MTDMIYNLRVRLRQEGKGAAEAKKAIDGVGQSAQATGNRVKQTLRWQNGAWQQVKQSTSEAGAAVKQMGGTLDRLATVSRRTTDTVKRGMVDDARAVRASGIEVDRLGRGMDRLRMATLRSLTGLRSAAGVVRREFDGLHKVLGGVGGRLATLGLGVGAAQTLRNSARLDRTNIQLRQTADMSPADVDDWRNQMWAMARANGNDPDAIGRGMGQLVAAGLNYRQALPAAKAADVASTISGADQGQLGDYQVTAAAIFNEDLAKKGTAERLLAQGLVGGRMGRAELPDLPNIFPRVGGSAQQAGLNYAQTIGYIEALSNIESQPERLATLADSGLRMFTNGRYRKQVTQATGVRFFNKAGATRDPFDIFSDLRSRYEKLKTNERRAAFMQAVVGNVDQDTARNFRAFLMPGRIEQARDYGAQISKVTAFDPAQLEENRKSATATAGRVRATIGEALDKAAQPINKALAETAQYLLDDKGLSGGQLIGGAAALGAGAYFGARGGRWAGNKAMNGLVKMLGGSADTVKNIVVGHALQASTGVTPVYVTNWSGAPGGVGGPVTNAIKDAAVGEAAVAAEAGGVARASRAAKMGRLGVMDVLLPFAFAEAIGGIQHHVFDPLKTKEKKALLSSEREFQKKRLGLTDEQYNRYEVLDQSPASIRDAQRRGYSVSGLQAHEDWLVSQARGSGMLPNAAQAAAAATAIGSAARSPLGRWLSPTMADGVASWAAQQAARLDPAAAAGPSTDQVRQVSDALNEASRVLQQLVGKPLQIEVTSDTAELHARVNQRHERDMRRGG